MASPEPVRTCVGCRTRRSQAELVRVYMDDRGRVLAGRTGSGRGAWLCAATTGACLTAAVDQKAFNRAFRAAPDKPSVERLQRRWPGPGTWV
ncbi:MAG: YlxR family protein [Actinomycetota bacterium]